MRVLAFAASLRKDSLNRKLIHQATIALKTQAGVEVDLADFREFEMPMYDGDLEDASGTPQGGLEFVKRLRGAQAVVISTPEYNGSMPGTLKNAIDWASREEPMPFTAKPLLLIGASPGAFGALRSISHARVPLASVGAFVHPDTMGVSHAHQAFDEAGGFIDPKNRARLEALIASFVKFARNLQNP
jgi:NAD(P)H-dependent FMN reductase